jgi:hypothetical protein
MHIQVYSTTTNMPITDATAPLYHAELSCNTLAGILVNLLLGYMIVDSG